MDECIGGEVECVDFLGDAGEFNVVAEASFFDLSFVFFIVGASDDDFDVGLSLDGEMHGFDELVEACESWVDGDEEEEDIVI